MPSPPLPQDARPRPRPHALLVAAAGLAVLVALAALGASGVLGRWLPPVDPALVRQARAAVEARAAAEARAVARPPLRFTAATRRLAANQTVGQALLAMGLGAEELQAVLAALREHVPFRRARPGDQIRLERRQDGALHRLAFRQGPADEWTVRRAPDGSLTTAKRPVEIRTGVSRVAVVVRGSVYESLQAAGEDPALAVEAADVLAWDVDFFQDVRDGDSMKVVVEKVFADGRPLRSGAVLAVEYAGAAAGVKRLFRYTDPSGQTAWFDDDGQSARRGFLKAPLRYLHVTSRYGNRRHPVLQYTRAHQGVDYGAPAGTPVWAVGDGMVEQAGWNGGCGKSVTLRHRNGYETVYCHLSRVAVAAGARVSQKQVLGAVGRSGLATGPHLHYAVKRGGAYVNPLQLKVPRGAPVPPEWREDFQEKIGPVRARLDQKPVA
ncbi:MAG TPA: M23 family metallopeptidase [Anaeromyxobacteraceae bacterium]|nr:M23 family metallopeptidase [Anaeromyxobacteraceae bacterium]